MKPLNTTQINRILKGALNSDAMRGNPNLDTNTIIGQFNLNHMRTLNQLTFAKLLTSSLTDIQAVHCHSTDPALFPEAKDMFPETRPLFSIAAAPFSETSNSFKFNSLWSKKEPISVVRVIQTENYNLEKAPFFVVPEKSMKLEEFSLAMQQSGTSLALNVKDLWVNALTNAVRSNLKEVKKGWFNVEESSLEVYSFSKLKKFLLRINFMAEDTLRIAMTRIVKTYAQSIIKYCPDRIEVISNEVVNVTGGKSPLFTVEIKFVNPSPGQPAMFVYSSGIEAIFDAILVPFDMPFELLKGIVKVEKRVMKKVIDSNNCLM
jgi:dynein heavy chain